MKKYNKFFALLLIIVSIGVTIMYYSHYHYHNINKTNITQIQFVQKYLGNKFIFPDNLIIIPDSCNKYMSFEDIEKNNLIISTIIWSDCLPCVQELEKWELFEENFADDEVTFLYFIYTSNYKSFLQNIYPEINIHSPLLIDTLNLYCELNNINPHQKLYNTFLLDKDYKVILIGNPIVSSQIKNLYFEKIKGNEKQLQH